jgi:hypothetical protein
MSTKSREVIFGSRIRGAKKARGNGQGRPPVKLIAPMLKPGQSEWQATADRRNRPRQGLEVECNHCKTHASLPAPPNPPATDTPIWKLEPR